MGGGAGGGHGSHGEFQGVLGMRGGGGAWQSWREFQGGSGSSKCRPDKSIPAGAGAARLGRAMEHSVGSLMLGGSSHLPSRGIRSSRCGAACLEES